MTKIDPSMSTRLAEEFYRMNVDMAFLTRKIGCHNSLISAWVNGRYIPNAFYLAQLHRAGFDVIYILTGERTR